MLGGGIRIYPRFFAVARVNLRSMPFNGVRDLPVIKREFSACALNEANHRSSQNWQQQGCKQMDCQACHADVPQLRQIDERDSKKLAGD